MVSTVLSAKPKPAEKSADETSVAVDEESKNESCCCRKRIWWSIVKFLVSLTLLCFFSLIVVGQGFTLYSVTVIGTTHVETIIEYPRNVSFPAVTVCNNNGILQSKFCAKFPEHCANKSTGEKKIDLSKNEDWVLVKNMTAREIAALGQERHELVPSCAQISPSLKETQCKYASRIMYRGMPNCFTFLSSPNELTGDYRKSGLWMGIDFQTDENTNSLISVGGRIFIHDANQRIPDQFPMTGHRIKPGLEYRVLVKKTTHNRLPAPFDTGCKNYNTPTDGYGILNAATDFASSQKECYNECLIRSLIGACGCMPDYVPHINDRPDFPDCSNPDNKTRKCLQRTNLKDEFEKLCDEECPIACVEDQYEVDIESTEIPMYNNNIKKARRNQAYVLVGFESNEHKMYMYNSISDYFDADSTIQIMCLYCLVVLVFLWLTIKTMVDICRSCKRKSSPQK